MTAGVYKIIDSVTGNFYVGGSKNVSKREINHRTYLKGGNHHSPGMQAAYNQDPKRLTFKLVLVCKEEDVKFYEQLVMDEFKPEFNILKNSKGPDSEARKRSRKPGPHREETKEKIRKAQKGIPCPSRKRGGYARAEEMKRRAIVYWGA